MKHDWEQVPSKFLLLYHCWRCGWTESVRLASPCPGMRSRQPVDGPQIPVGDVA